MLQFLKNLTWDWNESLKNYTSHLKYQVSSRTFRSFSILAVAFLILLQVFTPGSASALNPRFNFLAGDYELLRGANSSTGETTWHDPISAKVGDVISWNVYYHNGVENTTATNTKIQVVLPQNSATQLVLQGKLWADNAEMVTDTGTVNLNSAAKIRYIPGSTIWYKDGSKTPQSLPNGITEGGVNLGNILGCWQYSGFVVFQTEIISSQVALTLDKKVGNSNEDPGTQNWYKENTAQPNQTLAYRLYIKNTGNDTAKNLKVRDILPGNISYLSGTTKAYTSQTGSGGIKLPDGIVSENGLNLGNFEPGDLNSGFVVFQVKIANLTTSGTYTLINTAEVWAENAAKVSSTATTIVNIGAAAIAKSKTAFNQTQNLDATKVVAKSGDIINYNLWTKNNGQSTAANFVTSDDITDILEYSNLINAYGGTLQGNTLVYPALSIESGQTINKTFSIQIKNPIPADPQSGKAYDFQMENVYGNTILVTVFKPQTGYYFNKKVRNLSRGEANYSENAQATYGEQIEYKIEVANTGNTALTQIKVWDILPQYQTLIAGSVKFFGPKGGTLQLSDSITSSGISLENFAAGTTGYIVFKVQIVSCPPAGIHNLINTAFARTAEIGQISDTANLQLIIYPPIEPPIK